MGTGSASECIGLALGRSISHNVDGMLLGQGNVKCSIGSYGRKIMRWSRDVGKGSGCVRLLCE